MECTFDGMKQSSGIFRRRMNTILKDFNVLSCMETCDY